MVQHWNFQPDGQVKNDVGNCLTAFGGPAPGTRVLVAGATVIRAKGGIALPDRRGFAATYLAYPSCWND
jgi:hypothetical protein